MTHSTSGSKFAYFRRQIPLVTSDVYIVWFLIVVFEVGLFKAPNGTPGIVTLSPIIVFLVLPMLIGLCVMAIRTWTVRNALRSLVLLPDNIVYWSTAIRSGKIPLNDVRRLNLYTTKLSAPGITNPTVLYAGSLHHRSGVILVEGLSGIEFGQLGDLFERLSGANSRIQLVKEDTPYSTDMETHALGG